MARSIRRWFPALLLLCAACYSSPLTIPTPPLAANERVLGEADGSATGLMLFQVIPINQNERYVNAYHRALEKYPGATRILDPTITEHWFWAYILNGYIFEVKGTAVGPK